MIKVESLKAWMVASDPDGIAQRPDSLTFFVEKGGMAIRGGIEAGFEYRYHLQMLITDYGGSQVGADGRTPAAPDYDAVLVAVLAWVAQNQPELLAGYATNNHAIDFSAEQVGDGKVDLMVELDLTEAVRLHPRPGGGFDVTHLPEQPYADCGCDGPRHWQLFVRDVLIAEWDEAGSP